MTHETELPDELTAEELDDAVGGTLGYDLKPMKKVAEPEPGIIAI